MAGRGPGGEPQLCVAPPRHHHLSVATGPGRHPIRPVPRHQLLDHEKKLRQVIPVTAKKHLLPYCRRNSVMPGITIGRINATISKGLLCSTATTCTCFTIRLRRRRWGVCDGISPCCRRSCNRRINTYPTAAIDWSGNAGMGPAHRRVGIPHFRPGRIPPSVRHCCRDLHHDGRHRNSNQLHGKRSGVRNILLHRHGLRLVGQRK